MRSWFIRHSERLGVLDDDVRRLWNEDRIAIHSSTDSVSLDSKTYSIGGERTAISRFVKFAEEGGYVWAQYRTHEVAKVGIVEPGTTIEIQYATWKTTHYANRTAKLKTLQLKKVHIIGAGEWMQLRAARPRQVTFSPWPSAYSKLQHIVENIRLDHAWENLSSTGQQEIVCSEFLRWHDIEGVPRLRWLLLPTGRTLKDVDICGVATDNKRLFAQVTFLEKNATGEKKRKLAHYDDGATHLIMFCRCGQIEVEDNILFVPVGEVVFKWLEANPVYASFCFSAE